MNIAKTRRADISDLSRYWRDERGPIRLMALVEGYAVMRRPGAIPFLVFAKDLLNGARGIVRDVGN